MTKPTSSPAKDVLYRSLTAFRTSLREAGVNQDVLSEMNKLLLSMHKAPSKGLLRESNANLSLRDNRDFEDFSILDLPSLRAFLRDGQTTRQQLEGIATQRFGIPKGSMRSYSSKRALIEKLESMVQNETAHKTIGALAKSNTVPDVSETHGHSDFAFEQPSTGDPLNT